MKFEVFHFTHKAAYSDESMMDIMMGRVDACTQYWSENKYNKVATVEAENLDQVFEKTNTIDRFWGDNEGVTLEDEYGRHRSTSTGDVIVDEAGVAHLVKMMGFEVIEKSAKKARP